ncbi:hypothetical protein Tco_0202083 [Tanacetum coccineum]
MCAESNKTDRDSFSLKVFAINQRTLGTRLDISTPTPSAGVIVCVLFKLWKTSFSAQVLQGIGFHRPCVRREEASRIKVVTMFAHRVALEKASGLQVDLPVIDGVHDTFHVSNLKKCLSDPTLQVPFDEIQVDAKLNFVEKPMEILKREFKKLKRSRIAIVKVRWNSKRGPEFTWEREDQMKLKYPYLFSDDSI